MVLNRRCAMAVMAALFAAPALAQGPASVPRPSDASLADAYIYLLGRALAVRQEHMDRKVPGFAYNTLHHNPLGSADFVNPNFDVAYLEA